MMLDVMKIGDATGWSAWKRELCAWTVLTGRVSNGTRNSRYAA
jgi:hypothetical protein